VGAQFEQAKPLAALFVALWNAIPARDLGRAIASLGWLREIGYDPAEHDFVRKYLPERGFDVFLTEDVGLG
jgi:hypothetical protein